MKTETSFRARCILLLLSLIVLLAATAFAQKPDPPTLGEAAPPVLGASENTDVDVVDGLPATVVGALDADDSTYNRQAGNCSGLSGIGTNVFYDTITFTNTSGILAALDVTTSDVGNTSTCTTGDTHLSVYSPTFNAVDPVTNCVTSNDDGGPGVCSALSFDLGFGETALLVVTSFGNGAQFDYQVNIDSPSCSDGIVYDDGSLEGGLRGPMGTTTFEISQRFDLPLTGAAGADVQRICACLSHTVSAIDDFPINLVVRRPAGNGTTPGARLRTEAAMVNDVPSFPTCQFFTVDLAGVTFDSDTIFVGVEWDQGTYPSLLTASDNNGPTTQPSFYTTNQGMTWNDAEGLDPDYRNLGVRVTFEEPFEALSDSSGLLLPGFEIDLDDPSGPTTFLNVRNTTDSIVEITIEYHGEEVTDTPLRVDGATLSPQGTEVVDIRGDVTGLDPDADQIVRALALVRRSDTDDATGLEGDFLDVDFGNDFAAGDRLYRIPDDLCEEMEIRFLDFGSGTRFAVILNQPRGDTAASATFDVYNQAGSPLVVGGELFTNQHLNFLTAEELAGPSNRFGTVVFDFSKSGGGLVVGKYSAFGRFSVELNGACRD